MRKFTENEIGADGAIKIGEILKINTTLTSLNLSSCNRITMI